ncbi:MAG: hypothetical protein ACQESR_28615 [Planctomycetota bacterium]
MDGTNKSGELAHAGRTIPSVNEDVGNRGLLRLLRHPVEPKTRSLLRRKWRQLPPELRTPQQLYGRFDEGCGATVGVMPRRDFGCVGCYLGKQANSRT